MMNDAHYGFVVNTYWDHINMLSRMKDKNPQRFNNFRYSNETIYHYIDKLQQEQHIYD